MDQVEELCPGTGGFLGEVDDGFADVIHGPECRGHGFLGGALPSWM